MQKEYTEEFKENFIKKLEAFHKLADELTIERVLEIWENDKKGNIK